MLLCALWKTTRSVELISQYVLGGLQHVYQIRPLFGLKIQGHLVCESQKALGRIQECKHSGQPGW